MAKLDWLEELSRRAKTDPYYQLWVDDIKTLEPDYYAFLYSLPEDKQKLIGDYLTSCVSAECDLGRIAYQVGIEHGKIEMQREFSRRKNGK